MRPAGFGLRRAVSVLLAFALALGSALGLAQVANAATPGITSKLLLNGATVTEGAVIDEGSTLTLRVQYDKAVGAGTSVEFDFGENVTLTNVPGGNTAIESIVTNDNKVTITFKDPWPNGVDQGVFDLSVKVNTVEQSAHDTITWTIDGEESSVDVIVRNSGDQFANVKDTQAKSVSPGNLNSFVTVVDGQVKLKPEIVNQELTYTLTLGSPNARTNFPITDSLPAGLSYLAGSFAGALTTWDENGFNRTVDPDFGFSPTITGSSFSGTVTVPGPSELRITYKAKVDSAAIAALEAQLQANYEVLGGGTGNFGINLTNTAHFGETEKTASVQLQGTVAGVNVGQAFAKSSDWSTRNVVANEAGDVQPPAAITYTLTADLTRWTGGPNFTLERNVVVEDVLPAQAVWDTADEDFITASGVTLSPASAADCTATTVAADFAADSLVGRYCVSGQKLLVNVGKDTTKTVAIEVKALLNSVDGLSRGGSTTIEGATAYQWPNAASYYYRVGNPHRAERNVTVVVLPEGDEGINDSSVFTKTGKAQDATIQPGESVTMDYTFTVAAGKGIDARTSKIVDYIDTDVFDLSDLDDVAISGSYNGQTLNASHFALSTDDDGNLVIELSDDGKAIVDAQTADKKYEVKIQLTTVPFDGKVTKTITNRATLFGAEGEPLFWSTSESEATSYGDEAEVRKRVFDRGSEEWVETLPALMDGQGNLRQDTYVYRIEFIPHGSYDNVVIVPVADVLPGATEFLGFVSEDDAATGESPTPGPVDIGGNLIATYDTETATVTLEQKPGTNLDSGGFIGAFVKVRITDASAPIVNRIGNTSATIVPVRSVSVGDFVWVDSNRDGRQDPGEPGIPGVVLTLVGPDGEPVTDVFGEPVGPVTTGPNGEYTFGDLPALTGEQTYTVRIDREASAEVLAPYVPTEAGQGDRAGDSSTWQASTEPGDLHEDGDRDPTLDFGFVTKTYAIGDFVWIDADSDGVQGDDEDPLAGVKVELLVDGQVIAVTATDANGRYVFDNLPAGTYQVRFTLTAEQQAKYEFTSRNSGSDSAVDSDANPADGLTVTIVLDDSNPALTGEYEYREISATQGIDPTWDAGVVLRTVTAPDDEEDDDNGILPITGGTIGLGILAAALLLVGGGGLMLRISRRRAGDMGFVE